MGVKPVRTCFKHLFCFLTVFFRILILIFRHHLNSLGITSKKSKTYVCKNILTQKNLSVKTRWASKTSSRQGVQSRHPHRPSQYHVVYLSQGPLSAPHNRPPPPFLWVIWISHHNLVRISLLDRGVKRSLAICREAY